MFLPRSQLAEASRRTAGLVTAAVVLSWLILGSTAVLSPATAPAAASAGRRPGADIDMYRAIRDRLASGTPYYDAYGAELRARNFPRWPVFHWRTPAHLTLLAALPSLRWAQGSLTALLIAAALLAWRVAKRLGSSAWALLVAALVVTGGTAAALPDLALFSEIWCGMLVLLAALLAADGRAVVAALTCALALFFRELALPFAVAGLAAAARAPRGRDLWIWAAGLGAWAVYLAVHTLTVRAHLLPGDLAATRGWLGFGGPRFLLETATMHPLLQLLPRAGVAAVLPLAFLGIMTWPASDLRFAKLGLALFSAAMLLVGLDHNAYWGVVSAPLLSLGLAAAPGSVRDLLIALRRPRPSK